MLPAARESLPPWRDYRYRVPDFLMSARVSASAAVSAVVALPHGLLDSLVFRVLVVARPLAERATKLGAGFAPGSIVEHTQLLTPQPREPIEGIQPVVPTHLFCCGYRDRC
jgi:hypothetical protein